MTVKQAARIFNVRAVTSLVHRGHRDRRFRGALLDDSDLQAVPGDRLRQDDTGNFHSLGRILRGLCTTDSAWKQ
jgi:hypothetical protein